MRREQITVHRDKELNTETELVKYLVVSACLHVLFVIFILLSAIWGSRQDIIKPGIQVSFVTLPAPVNRGPQNLPIPKPLSPEPPSPEPEPEPAPVPKPEPKPEPIPPAPEPEVKKPEVVKEVKTEPEVKFKKSSDAKKVVAKEEPKKKEQPKEPPKKTKPEPEKTPPKKEEPQKLATSQQTPTKEPSKTSKGAPSGGQNIVEKGEWGTPDWYQNLIGTKIDQNWVTFGVDISNKRNDPVVQFRINKNGTVTGIKIRQSSGSLALDESAMEAVSKSMPFPPLPPDFQGEFLDVEITLNYERSHGESQNN